MGDCLIDGNYSNVKGHFEDKDFCYFHKDLLASNGQNHLITSNEQLPIISEYFQKRAENLVQFKNDLRDQWGWKDPRTCLFPEFWQSICPNAKFLIVFRNYAETVDSLLRRRIVLPKRKRSFIKSIYYSFYLQGKIRNKYLTLTDTYLKTWIYHNNRLLDFIDGTDQDSYFLIDQSSLPKQNNQVEKWLVKAGFEFESGIFEQIYNNNLQKSELEFFDLNRVDDTLLQEANNTLFKLTQSVSNFSK